MTSLEEGLTAHGRCLPYEIFVVSVPSRSGARYALTIVPEKRRSAQVVFRIQASAVSLSSSSGLTWASQVVMRSPVNMPWVRWSMSRPMKRPSTSAAEWS